MDCEGVLVDCCRAENKNSSPIGAGEALWKRLRGITHRRDLGMAPSQGDSIEAILPLAEAQNCSVLNSHGLLPRITNSASAKPGLKPCSSTVLPAVFPKPVETCFCGSGAFLRKPVELAVIASHPINCYFFLSSSPPRMSPKPCCFCCPGCFPFGWSEDKRPPLTIPATSGTKNSDRLKSPASAQLPGMPQRPWLLRPLAAHTSGNTFDSSRARLNSGEQRQVTITAEYAMDGTKGLQQPLTMQSQSVQKCTHCLRCRAYD